MGERNRTTSTKSVAQRMFTTSASRRAGDRIKQKEQQMRIGVEVDEGNQTQQSGGHEIVSQCRCNP